MLLDGEFLVLDLVLVAYSYLLGVLGLLWSFLVVDDELAAGWTEDIGQNVNEGCFSRAVSAQKTEYLSLLYSEIQSVKCIKLALLKFIGLNEIGNPHHDVIPIYLIIRALISTIRHLITQVKLFSQ